MANASQWASVAPSTLALVPETHSLGPDRQFQPSTPSSLECQDSSARNATDSSCSTPSSILSPTSSSILPLAPLIINPLIRRSVKETEVLQAEEAIEAPKRSRGRPVPIDYAPRATSVAPSTKTKIQGRNTSRCTSTALANGIDGQGDEKHSPNYKKDCIRSRNRKAAYKCRQKKQRRVRELQNQEAITENINKNFCNEAAQLQCEIPMLKNMVLQHGGCGCSFIDEYISRAAQSLVQHRIAPLAPPLGVHM
ncbi:hypothetical protein LZ31DRAFT_485416 [Colletotrichum somersetense]|nr:hypothetical protein LZ31DRAFT_485416 [Colletotrichum somersetense]